MNQDELLQHALFEKKIVVVRMIYFYRMYENFWMRNFELAYSYAEKHTFTKGPGQLKENMIFFYKGLMAFYFARESGKQKWIDEGEKSVDALKSWAENYKWNYENKYFLLLAEYHNSLRDCPKAEYFYMKAVESAHDHRFPHEKGLSLELLGYFYFQQGDIIQALKYMGEARVSYEVWGAVRKIQSLDAFIATHSP